MHTRALSFLAASLTAVSLMACAPVSSEQDQSSSAATTEAHAPLATTTESFDLPVEPGLSLQGKLDVPVGPAPSGGWPVLLMLEGSGRIDVDFTMVVKPTTPEQCSGAGPDGKRPDGTQVPCYKVDQLYATRAASLGMAVARLGKRGITVDAKNPFVVHEDLAAHGTGTLSKRVADVGALVERLARDPRLDTNRLHFWGISEGSAVSTLFAAAKPERAGGLILVGPVLDSIKDLYRFQTVTVQFDQLLAIADADGDRRVSKTEYANANLYANPQDWSWSDPVFRQVLSAYRDLGHPATFETFDMDHDESIDHFEMDTRLDEDLWQPLLAAVANDDAASAALVDSDNSLAQLKEAFATPSIAPKLLALDVPITIVVGKRDLNTPSAQLDWFVPLAQAHGRTNITTSVIENTIGPGGAMGHHYGPLHVDRVIARIEELHWAKR